MEEVCLLLLVSSFWGVLRRVFDKTNLKNEVLEAVVCSAGWCLKFLSSPVTKDEKKKDSLCGEKLQNRVHVCGGGWWSMTLEVDDARLLGVPFLEERGGEKEGETIRYVRRRSLSKKFVVLPFIPLTFVVHILVHSPYYK
jgi:hypothetical protein